MFSSLVSPRHNPSTFFHLKSGFTQQPSARESKLVGGRPGSAFHSPFRGIPTESIGSSFFSPNPVLSVVTYSTTHDLADVRWQQCSCIFEQCRVDTGGVELKLDPSDSCAKHWIRRVRVMIVNLRQWYALAAFCGVNSSVFAGLFPVARRPELAVSVEAS